MPSHRRSGPWRRRRAAYRPGRRLISVVAGLAVVVTAGLIGPSVVHEVVGGGTDRRQLTLAGLPADAPDRGLVYEGLKPGRPGSLCAGSYELDEATCTHGPDAAPAGLTVRRDVAAVTARSPAPVPPARETAGVPTDAEIARDEGGSALTADAPALIPDAAPGAADFIMGAHGVACEGDGRGGNRVQMLYLHEFGTPSRYTDFAGSIRTWSAGIDQIFDASAAETGGSRHIRYVTTPECRVDVAEVQLPSGALDSFPASIAALRTLGYNRTDRKYVMFADANVYCGIAGYVADRRPGLGNRNNGGPSYGRVDAGCWSSAMAAHELTHTLGAVLPGSPNSGGAAGCLDDYDLLCGADRSVRPVRAVCPRKHENRLDCGHDDYFSTDPRPGSYLGRNWNLAQSGFLLRGDGGDDAPAAGPGAGSSAGAPAPTTAPGVPTPSGTADPGAADGGGDAPPSIEASPEDPTRGPSRPATPTPPEQAGGDTQQAVAAHPVAGIRTKKPKKTESPAAGTGPTPDPVQAVLEIRDATSSSVRLMWSAAGPAATYEVFVDDEPIATTKATRARLIGLRPDARYEVTVRSGRAYTARGTVETAPAGRPAQNSWFVLTNALTGGAADLYAARQAGGTPLTLSGADGGTQQQWKLSPAADGGYTLMSRATGECVVPLGGNPVAGTPLVQGDCADGNGVRWSLLPSQYGFTLHTTVGDMVAGVGGQRFGDHRVLVLQNAAGRRHQSWAAVPE